MKLAQNNKSLINIILGHFELMKWWKSKVKEDDSTQYNDMHNHLYCQSRSSIQSVGFRVPIYLFLIVYVRLYHGILPPNLFGFRPYL